jgi:hypothetical protein
MKQVFALLALAAACGAATVHGAEIDPSQKSQCEQPDFPSRSTSMESVRRVEKALREWRACFRAAATQAQSVDEMLAYAHDYQQLKARHDSWVKATVSYSNGQAYGRLAATRVERDFWENLMADRSDGAPHASAPRPSDGMLRGMGGAN